MELNRLKSIPLKDIKIDDIYWSRYINTIFSRGIKHQWEILNDRIEGVEKSHCISNFMIAAGLKTGEFGGKVFQDTDLAKWIEAAAYSLEIQPDSELEKLVDWSVDLVEKAQQKDGYVNTYYTIVEPEGRWKNLMEGHELYTAGHFIEAAVAYYNATGKDKLLKIMCRFADYICQVFGEEENLLKGYPGHPEVELALVKLYHVTGIQRYKDLAKFFVDRRGSGDSYFKQELENRNGQFIFPEMALFDDGYFVNHSPIREQVSAEGHAVRNVYLYCAVADLAHEYQDKSLLDACKAVFDNIVGRRMYITGSIGSAELGERFTSDYDLPNHSNYSETCASIGLALFCRRMLEIEKDARYADIMERTLYNSVLSGISLKGDKFFYVNPLEVIPDVVENNPNLRHVKSERQGWFGVACCPPNIIRTLASLGQYIYSSGQEELFVNLFISNQAQCRVGDRDVNISIASKYPYESNIKLTVSTSSAAEFTLAFRIPAGCTLKELKVDGKKVDIQNNIEKGYVKLNRCWRGTAEVEINLDMPSRLMVADTRVSADIGKAALVKGPLVYCLEQADNGNHIFANQLDLGASFDEKYEEDLLGGAMAIYVDGEKLLSSSEDNELYHTGRVRKKPVKLKFIPYSLWNNRGRGEMQVWTRYKT
ncbi:MAG: glycosyhydrolase [Eubacterium sp.]|nr:glycosyhydrolase [Eubacterium sp.]